MKSFVVYNPAQGRQALILDIVFVALLKAYFRRRRPTENINDAFAEIGPDQYSFPSASSKSGPQRFNSPQASVSFSSRLPNNISICTAEAIDIQEAVASPLKISNGMGSLVRLMHASDASSGCSVHRMRQRTNMWLQLDGAPPHYHCEVRQFLNANFRNRWIGRNGFQNWPPRPPDLTPLDFFLWGT
ncbi:hypothetical protein HUJ05_008728 [Dendroctonus ponderosae]|nr:hypothetical protein HUJ05_008728 [Dendroctonus ponderosae]